MELQRFNYLGATLTFFALAVLVAAVMWALTASGNLVIPGHTVSSWFEQAAFIAAYAALAGAMVDAIRLLARVVWRQQPKANPDVTKIIRRHHFA